MSKSVFIGIPCFDMVTPEVLEDYMRFAYYLGRRYQEYNFYLGIKTKSEQFRARNEIVKAALDIGVDYLLMIDDDHIIDFDETQWATKKYEFLKTLIGHIEKNPKIGLVGALYYERGNKCRPVLMKKITPANYEWLTDDEIQGRLQPVDVQGGGVMLLNMKIFDWIPGPMYFEPELIYGTDIQIARKVQEAGFEVYSDTSIEIGHLRAQRMIVTNKTRRDVLSLSRDKDDIAKLICSYGRMVIQYRDDIKEFLGIDEALAADMHIRYEDYWQRRFEEYSDPRQWYIESSRDFLGRQVIVNNPEKPSNLYGIIMEAIKSDIPLHGLDFACGPSVVGFELARLGHYMTFCDIPESETTKFLKWRCEKYGVKAKFVTTIDNIPDGSFNFIMALDAVEHFPEDEAQKLVNRMSDLLIEDGLLLCNFMTNYAFEFPEHLFMNKTKFMTFITESNLFPLSHFIYTKTNRFYEEKQVEHLHSGLALQ
jgi:hypothetical protein